MNTSSIKLASILIPFSIALGGCQLVNNLEFDDGLERGDTIPLAVPLRTQPAFSNGCGEAPEGSEKITIGFVGDVLMHGTLQKQAIRLRHKDRFRSIWRVVERHLQEPDITYANLEGPTAPTIGCDGSDQSDPGYKFSGECRGREKHPGVYTSYSSFNYHPSLIEDLKLSGVDVVSTSNNHTLDRGWKGADQTITELNKYNMLFTGTRSSENAKANTGDWHTVTSVNKNNMKFNIAWLACTYGMNRKRDKFGSDRQVLTCFKRVRNRSTGKKYTTANPKVIELIEELAATPGIDGVVVTPHWGRENQGNSNGLQENVAQKMVDAGAVAVIGSHPHVLQPWQKLTDKNGREAIVIYSLANFVSNQGVLDAERAASIIFYVGLGKDPMGNVWIDGVSYLPTRMVHRRRDPVRSLEPFAKSFVKVGYRDEGAWKDIYKKFPESHALTPEEKIRTDIYCR